MKHVLAIERAQHWLIMLLKGCPSETGVTDEEDVYQVLLAKTGNTYKALKDLKPFYVDTLPLAKSPTDPAPATWFNEMLEAVRYEENELKRNTIIRERAGWLLGWLDSELRRLKKRTPTKRRGRPGRPSTIERDKKLWEEFRDFEGSKEAFARTKRMHPSTCKDALERGRVAFQLDE